MPWRLNVRHRRAGGWGTITKSKIKIKLKIFGKVFINFINCVGATCLSISSQTQNPECCFKIRNVPSDHISIWKSGTRFAFSCPCWRPARWILMRCPSGSGRTLLLVGDVWAERSPSGSDRGDGVELENDGSSNWEAKASTSAMVRDSLSCTLRGNRRSSERRPARHGKRNTHCTMSMSKTQADRPPLITMYNCKVLSVSLSCLLDPRN